MSARRGYAPRGSGSSELPKAPTGGTGQTRFSIVGISRATAFDALMNARERREKVENRSLGRTAAERWAELKEIDVQIRELEEALDYTLSDSFGSIVRHRALVPLRQVDHA